MNLTEVTNLMEWITDNTIAEYVRIDPLRDFILDLLVSEELTPIIKDQSEPVLN